MTDLKKGDIIYRVIKVEDLWYYCIYEVVKYQYLYFCSVAKLQIAPILTYYEAKYSSVSTLLLNNISENWIEFWPHSWDYITTNEDMAKCIYYEKTGCLKQ